jgi:peptidase E
MVNLLAIWRAQGLDAILREAWEAGIVLAGLSAGSMCWFEHGVSTSHGHPAPVRGLGFLPGSNSVHHDSEPSRRPVYLEAVRTSEIPPGYAADDGAALVFRGRTLHEVVSARPTARAYAVDEAGERALPARRITAAPRPTAVAEFRRSRLARLAD